MKKILLTIQYDGTNFCGWQTQKNGRSVQSVLEEALSNLLNEKITLYASGRTDSGVHAIAQTAHFETSSNFDIKKLPIAVNSKLPSDVAVLKAKYVSKNFHARFSVKKKTYLYRTYFSNFPLPLFENKKLKIPPRILDNFDKITEAKNYLIGTHNFKAFCSSQTQTQSFERTIFDIKIKKSKNNLDFYITGNGFLYNMVRIIVGTLLAVGEGKILPSDLPKIIKSQDRTKAGKTLPPYALYLFNVKYK